MHREPIELISLTIMNNGDITKQKEDIPVRDVLLAVSCQPFSIAGIKKFSDVSSLYQHMNSFFGYLHQYHKPHFC